MSTTLKLAKKALMPLAILASLAIAQPASAITGAGGKLKYGLQWFHVTPDGKGQGHDALDNSKWAARTDLGTIYDPAKPTMIYFHGWARNSNGVRENFAWTHNKETVDTLKNWRADGWNVGVFYWDQFADEGEFGQVSQAEAKIWSSKGPTGLRYKYYFSPGIHIQSGSAPKPDELNLPNFVSGAARWGTTGSRQAQINAAIQFIYGLDPARNQSLYATLDSRYTKGKTCPEFVKETACDTSSGLGSICQTHRPMWDEVFTTKICELPSVGDIAVLNILRAMPNQTGEVRFAGHSLGHQLATRTAMHLWAGYHNGKSSAYKKVLPRSIDLLDPYATSGKKNYLRTGFTYSQGNLGPFTRPGDAAGLLETGSTADRVYHYVSAIKGFAQRLVVVPGPPGKPGTVKIEGPFNGQPFVATYYMSTALARTTGSTHNPRLINTIPSQRLFFDYMGTLDLTARHNGARFWYFNTYDTHGALTPTSGKATVDGKFFPFALGPEIVADGPYMDDVGYYGVHFAQSGGKKTFTTHDDTFSVCVKDLAFIKSSLLSHADYSCPNPQ